MQPTAESVDLFLATTARPEEMARVDAIIVEAMRGSSRRLWRGDFWGGTEQSIIGYGDYSQSRPGGKKVDWFLVGLALQKRHFSLYVNAVEDGRYLSQVCGARLGKVKVGAAAVTFASLDDLDLVVLGELLARAALQLPNAE